MRNWFGKKKKMQEELNLLAMQTKCLENEVRALRETYRFNLQNLKRLVSDLIDHLGLKANYGGEDSGYQFHKKSEPVNQVFVPPVEEQIKMQQRYVDEVRETLIDLIHHLGLEEDHSYEPRRHVFRKRKHAKRER